LYLLWIDLELLYLLTTLPQALWYTAASRPTPLQRTETTIISNAAPLLACHAMPQRNRFEEIYIATTRVRGREVRQLRWATMSADGGVRAVMWNARDAGATRVTTMRDAREPTHLVRWEMRDDKRCEMRDTRWPGARELQQLLWRGWRQAPLRGKGPWGPQDKPTSKSHFLFYSTRSPHYREGKGTPQRCSRMLWLYWIDVLQ
jgi:hypothetical protein